MVLVARGGRERYVCSKCKKFIAKGEPHNRDGSSPNFKRYHLDCTKVTDKSAVKQVKKTVTKTQSPVMSLFPGSNKLQCGNCGAVFFMGVGSKFTFCPTCHAEWKYIAVKT